MKLHHQFQTIRDLVASGNLKDAITNLRQMAEGSANLNDVIIQASRLNTLQMEIITGVTSYQDQNVTRSQITKAMLDMVAQIEGEMKIKGQGWQAEINNTLDEIIRKHGISPYIHQVITAHRNLDRTHFCLWIDDNPGNDQMEMQAIMSLGLECQTAKNPYEAYRMMQAKKPDIIIINSLSRLKGDENEGIGFCQYLAKQEVFSSIPILLHSVRFQQKLEELKEYSSQSKLVLPNNIKNDLQKNTLIIRDLIEEIVRIVFGANNMPEANDKPLRANKEPESSNSEGSTIVDSENVGTVNGFGKRIRTKPTSR